MAAPRQPHQPVNRAKKHGHITHRDAIWEAIRAIRQGITSEGLQHHTGVHIDTIKSYVRGLDIAGVLKKTGRAELQAKPGQTRSGRQFTCYTYDLVKDTGTRAPRINKHGETVSQGNGRQHLWQAMRVLGNFSLAELLAHANTSAVNITESTAKDYLKHLNRAGYFRMQRGKRGRTRYTLIRNTGPTPPMVQKTKAVYDANQRKVMWQMPEGDALDIPVDMIEEAAK